jgi:hypothetical protein
VLEGGIDGGDVGRQRPHRTLDLPDLALAEPGQGARHDPRHLDAEVGREVGRPREEVVAGEDRDGVVPAGVRGRRAATGRRLVDHVVVVERREVDELDDHAGVHELTPGGVTEVPSQRHHQRAEPLAAGADQVAGHLVDEGVARGHLLVEPVLDGVEHPGDGQAVCLELVEDRGGDGQAGAAAHRCRSCVVRCSVGAGHLTSLAALSASCRNSCGWIPR